MMYPFITLDDNTQIVHSELLPSGQVKVCVEKPVHLGFNSATCILPTYEWSEVEGFSKDDLRYYESIIADAAHLIYRYAETGGFLNAEGF